MKVVRGGGSQRSEHTVKSQADMANNPGFHWIPTDGPQSPASTLRMRDLMPEGGSLQHGRFQGEWVKINK